MPGASLARIGISATNASLMMLAPPSSRDGCISRSDRASSLRTRAADTAPSQRHLGSLRIAWVANLRYFGSSIPPRCTTSSRRPSAIRSGSQRNASSGSSGSLTRRRNPTTSRRNLVFSGFLPLGSGLADCGTKWTRPAHLDRIFAGNESTAPRYSDTRWSACSRLLSTRRAGAPPEGRWRSVPLKATTTGKDRSRFFHSQMARWE